MKNRRHNSNPCPPPPLSGWHQWTTQAEIRFIVGIGTQKHCNRIENPKVCNKSRLELLQSYKQGMEQRTEWGDMNKYEVMDRLDKEILREQDYGM